MLNLDTHILVDALTGRLTEEESELLSGDSWSISSIVLWEMAKLVQLDRLRMDLTDPEVVRVLSRIHTWPLTLEICTTSTMLDFGSDPADELIAATSVVHGVLLVTRDRRIRSSQMVPLAR